MTVIFAEIGVTALYLLFAWLLSAIICGALAARKGYQEKSGLATGMLLFVLGIVVWLFWPAKEGSNWKVQGPIGSARPPHSESGGVATVAAERVSGRATASLVLGVLGIVAFPIIFSVLAIVFGRMAQRDIEATPGLAGYGTARAGTILGIVGLSLYVVFVLGFIVLLAV